MVVIYKHKSSSSLTQNILQLTTILTDLTSGDRRSWIRKFHIFGILNFLQHTSIPVGPTYPKLIATILQPRFVRIATILITSQDEIIPFVVVALLHRIADK